MFPSRTPKTVWILLFQLMLLGVRLSGQNSIPVEVSLLKTEQSGTNFPKYKVDKETLTFLVKTKPTLIQTWLTDRNGDLTLVLLSRTKIQRKSISNYIFYSGKVAENDHTLVSLTISNNQIRGFISDQKGNYSIQSNEDGRFEVKYPKNTKTSSWSCHTSMLTTFYDQRDWNTSYKSATSDTISIYFECDYALFELHAFSVAATESYVYNLFNQVQSIYLREGINIIIEDIRVWQEPDPYDQNSAEAALLDFRDLLGPGHPGTFAHLLSGNSHVNGGLAFINGLCNRDKSFAYSNLDLFIDPNGDYSWDVHVVAHEIGHNLGSPHTHDCVWGPSGNEAIDACGAPLPECENAPIPPEGGTIMSYCHTAPVGVNFSLGFGPEPGDLIRNMIGICREEEGDNCHNAIIVSDSGVYDTTPLDRGSGATHHPATHAKWYTFTPPSDGTIAIESCGQGIDTRLFLYSGNCNNLNELASSDDDCFSGGGYNYASIITNYPVQQGVTLFFEWDDRWNNEAFSFEFNFQTDPLTHCTNGIQDMDETGVDCGGSCTPCIPPPCQDDPDLPSSIEGPMIFTSMETVNYSGHVSSTGELDVRSGQEILLNPGFELEYGGYLEAQIEDCEE